MTPQEEALPQLAGASQARHQEPISAQQVVRAYNRYAPVYDRVFGAIYAHGVREMAGVVNRVAPSRLLEIGVGTGLALPHYPASTKVTGVDLAASMLAVARRRAAALPGRSIDLLEMNGESLQFPDDSFDCVAIPYVLPVTPNPDQLIAEARRVCRADGDILILNHFSGAGVWRAFEPMLRTFAASVGFRSDFSYGEHIERQDWTILSCDAVNLLGLSRLVHVRNG